MLSADIPQPGLAIKRSPAGWPAFSLGPGVIACCWSGASISQDQVARSSDGSGKGEGGKALGLPVEVGPIAPIAGPGWISRWGRVSEASRVGLASGLGFRRIERLVGSGGRPSQELQGRFDEGLGERIGGCLVCADGIGAGIGARGGAAVGAEGAEAFLQPP